MIKTVIKTLLKTLLLPLFICTLAWCQQPVNQAQLGGSNVYADPCLVNTPQTYAINFATSSTSQMVAGVANKNIYICGVFIGPVGGAINLNIVEGTGSNCSSVSSGLLGGTTAATGPTVAANSGFVLFAAGYWVTHTATLGDSICYIASGSSQVSGTLKYVIAP